MNKETEQLMTNLRMMAAALAVVPVEAWNLAASAATRGSIRVHIVKYFTGETLAGPRLPFIPAASEKKNAKWYRAWQEKGDARKADLVDRLTIAARNAAIAEPYPGAKVLGVGRQDWQGKFCHAVRANMGFKFSARPRHPTDFKLPPGVKLADAMKSVPVDHLAAVNVAIIESEFALTGWLMASSPSWEQQPEHWLEATGKVGQEAGSVEVVTTRSGVEGQASGFSPPAFPPPHH